MRIKVDAPGMGPLRISREELQRAEEAYGENDPRIVPFLNDLAFRIIGVVIMPNRCLETLPIYQKAVDILDKHMPADNLLLARARYRLAFAYFHIGKFVEAELLLLAALAVQEKQLSKDNYQLGATLTYLAFLFKETNRYNKGKSYYERALHPYYAKRERMGKPDFMADDRPGSEMMMGTWHSDNLCVSLQALHQLDIDAPKTCFIATAVFASSNHPAVLTLRTFRDEKLLPRWYGRLFIRLYYVIGPPLARALRPFHFIRAILKRLILLLVAPRK